MIIHICAKCGLPEYRRLAENYCHCAVAVTHENLSAPFVNLIIEATSEGTTEIFQALRDIGCGHCGATILTGERYGFLDHRASCWYCMTDCECGHAAYMHTHYTTGTVVDTCAGDNSACLCARLRDNQ